MLKFSFSSDENTCDHHSTCYRTVLRFQISLTEIFSNSMCVGSMVRSDKNAPRGVLKVFNTGEHVDSGRVF